MEQGVDIQHKQTKDRHNSMGKIVTFRNDRKEERKDKKNRQWMILIAKQLVMIGIFQNDNFKVSCSPKAFFHSSIDVGDNESTRNIGDKNKAAHEKMYESNIFKLEKRTDGEQ